MSTLLGLYTSKILSEHPLAVWALEDKADYVSLMDEQKRDMSLWSSESESIVVEDSTEITGPIAGEPVYSITDTPSDSGETVRVRLSGDTVGSFSSLDSSLGTFSVSSWVYVPVGVVLSVTLGISYNDPAYGTYDISKKVSRLINDKWMLMSETFDIPQGLSEDYSMFVEIEYSPTISLDPVTVFLSGTMVGQWSEEFFSTSMGVSPEFLSDDIYGIPNTTKGIRILGSLESTEDGYILANDTRLFARNFGMPLVYGSESSTTLYANTDLPSMLIPGLGFLNKSGQNKNYSLEFWMRINASASTEKRILGPVASPDGIYVDGPFLKLKVGEQAKSHFVGEWARPMLVHVVVAEQEISLLVNGESVAKIAVDRSTLNFPEEFIDNTQADWIGIYSYSDTTPFELSSISMYSYLVSDVIAKRRWVYGQAVDNPEALNTAFGGTNIYFDYEFSKYSNGYSYPKTGSWYDGINNNMEISRTRLSTPQYAPPVIISETSNQKQILIDNLELQNESETFLTIPQDSSIYFKKLNPLNDKLDAVSGVFKATSNNFENQTLFLIKDIVSGNYLEVFITPGIIWYSFMSYGQITSFAASAYPGIGEIFAVGLAFDQMASYFGNDLSAFLSNRDSLEFFVGGGPDKETFSGKIYDVSFLNSFAYKKSSQYFGSTGLLISSSPINQAEASGYILPAKLTKIDSVNGSWTYEQLLIDGILDGGDYNTASWTESYDGGYAMQYIASGIISNTNTSYSMRILEKDDTMYLDVYCYGSWTTSLPMSYFGKYVTDTRGNKAYDLDFIQLNIGYPSPGSFVRVTERDESWTYQDLNLKFSRPTQKRYSDLDNGLYTGYVDYTDLQYNSRQSYRYDTSSSLVRTYVYFKNVSSGMSNSESYYSEIVSPPKDGIVSPGTEWINTKYEVVDDMIIYPPTGVDFSKIEMFVEVVARVDGISDKPIAIDKLQLASVSLNDSYGTPIGTKFGTDVFPFTKNGVYYDFKTKNPFSIYKGSTPYLYLSKNSGIRVRGDFSIHGNRGIEIPVNPEKSSNYRMIALQFFAKFDDDFFPYAPTEILEIQSSSTHLKIFTEAAHPEGKRAKIYAVNAKTGQVENGIGFYVNGKLVKDAILTIKQWASVGIGLASFVDFSVLGGSIRITGPLTMTNISYYNAVNLQQIQNTSARPWLKVKQDGMVDLDWEYWEGQFKWFEVLVLSSSNFYGVDPSGIYKTYAGTSRVGIDDKTILRTGRYRYRMLTEATTDLFVIN
jgi:hypothetical protein